MEDAGHLMHELGCLMWLGGLIERSPTKEEARRGQQVYQHGDHEHKISIGWRRERDRAKADARREAEMAACPYIACTCGHHEE